MNVFAKFDEIPSMIIQDIKETKRYGHTVGRSDGLSDNVKTVYPPTNTVCGGYNDVISERFFKISNVNITNTLLFFVGNAPINIFPQRGLGGIPWGLDSRIIPTPGK